ncbi:hypothetical protein EDD66_105199 [Mobilisporobacter senegalensis]|uniref:Uncharacterized protein n=1 Tax=Mobilisporobacter senegalensis TaxID=1329262 RepID=A0A3N1XPS1_9FIRM|nr:hypothetical protein [Mobilisporobacter senegalensis]ROR28258.1 hypothetical protein EDD66_105199 [Mobilisporobacter senegalensis]
MIKESAEKLMLLDDIEWGNYAFSRDPLNRKIDSDLRTHMIKNANFCGIEQARKLKNQYGPATVKEYAKKLDLKIKYEDSDGADNYIVFAKFNYPDKVTIYQGNIEKVTNLLEEKDMNEMMEHVDIESMLLAHEMFHYMEEQDEKIYTRTETIELWKIGPLRNKSKLMAIGEIAAMAFARELLGISYSPYVFDAIMLYPHDGGKTQKLVDEILTFKKNRFPQNYHRGQEGE